jgi:hypothetical protein
MTLKRLIKGLLCLALLGVTLLYGCGLWAQRQNKLEIEQIRREELQNVAQAAYRNPSSQRPQECLARHAFEIEGPVEWPTASHDEQVFSPMLSDSIYDMNDHMTVADTRIAVILDREGKKFSNQIRYVELDKENAIAENEKEIAHYEERIAKTQKPDWIADWRGTVEQDKEAIAYAKLDHRFDTGLPDSLGVWKYSADVVDISGDRQDRIDHTVTAYIYRKPWLYIFEQTSPVRDPRANEARMRAFLQRFRTRAESEIPPEPGLCIPYGFIADDGTLPFEMKLGIRYRDTLGVMYVLDTGVLTEQTRPNGGALWDAMGVAGAGLLGSAGIRPENTRIVKKIGPKEEVIDGRAAIESGVVARVNGLDEEEKQYAHSRADYTPEKLEQVLNRKPYEVYTVYAGTNAKMNSQALPWLSVKMRTFARNQVFRVDDDKPQEVLTDPPPFSQSQPRFDALVHSLHLRTTYPPLPEVAALGYGKDAVPSAKITHE